MKNVLKKAFLDTLPVLTGYLVLGFGFGIVMKAAGFKVIHAVLMSLFIYAGSMQYAAVGLLTGGASLVTVALTTLMVNARHIFYGISMLERYKTVGKRKWYLVFALTDETYSLVSSVPLDKLSGNEKAYYLAVSAFNQFYWVAATALGGIVGSVISFNSEGIEFALTALFVTIFTEQWLGSKNHIPALVGLVITGVCLVIFSAEHFLIPAMLVIALTLCLYKGDTANE